MLRLWNLRRSLRATLGKFIIGRFENKIKMWRFQLLPRLLYPLQTALVKVHAISMRMLKRRCRNLRLVRRKSWPDLCDVKWFVTDRSETQRSNLGANHSLIAETAAHYRHLSNLLTWTLWFSKTILSSVGGSHINAQTPETTWCV